MRDYIGTGDLIPPEEDIKQNQMFEDLQRRATMDALSGLLNRATME